MRWRTVPIEALTVRELEGELAVRNAMTGSTHLLESPASEAFAALIAAKQGLTPAELATRLDAAAAVDDVEALLAEFQRLGLAEPID